MVDGVIYLTKLLRRRYLNYFICDSFADSTKGRGAWDGGEILTAKSTRQYAIHGKRIVVPMSLVMNQCNVSYSGKKAGRQ